MTSQDIAAALQRVESVLRRRPSAGLHDDAPATASWQSGTRVMSTHANGTQVVTDMPTELGGTGDKVTPGWLLRAGVASCFATCIAIGAAAEGIELTTLEIVASSRSDLRGMLGMNEDDGAPVCAGPRDVQLRVRIAARDVAPDRLRALVESSNRCSPMSVALQKAIPVSLHVEVGAN